jgi:hypothetical protein
VWADDDFVFKYDDDDEKTCPYVPADPEKTVSKEYLVDPNFEPY